MGVFCFSAYNLVHIYMSKNQVEKETKELKQYVEKVDDKTHKNVLSVDWEQLKKKMNRL